ncbi:MAG: DUF2147 domain-containing protein [Bacteroidales bacterium]|nr:DUF2147 domain-containing protein [Bacteroidales bacterium]
MTKISSVLVALFMAAIFAIPASAQVKADDILGVWLNEDEDAHIKIENRNGKYFGNIVWLKNPNEDDTGLPKLDDENPDPELQQRPVMGLELLSGFVFDGDDEWEDGDIYDPKSGKTYSCYMVFTDENKNNLKVRGFIGVSLLGKTTYWTRVK